MFFGPPARIYMFPSAGYDFSYLENADSTNGARQPSSTHKATASTASNIEFLTPAAAAVPAQERRPRAFKRRSQMSETPSTSSRRSTASRLSQLSSRAGHALTGGVFGMLGKHFEASSRPATRPASMASDAPVNKEFY